MDEHLVFHGFVFIKGTLDLPGADIQRVHILDAQGATLAVADRSPLGSEQTSFSAVFAAADYGADSAKVRVVRTDGQWFVLDDLSLHGLHPDGYHDLTARFFASLRAQGAATGGTAVEIGSRSRSGFIRRELVAPMACCGVDIVAGENVDVVCDAHNLRSAFGPNLFDAAFSISTFEHLAMPWKAVLELNYVLKPGATALIASHQTFPIHEAPWDFWRFSTNAWQALFNDATGFRVVETAHGEPAEITARFPHPATAGLETQPAYIGSVALVEKISDTRLSWDVPTVSAAPGSYPA